ncbi:MAG TPA: hypothetical protein VGC80_13680, partial [Acetobacteraceae bacterium]
MPSAVTTSAWLRGAGGASGGEADSGAVTGVGSRSPTRPGPEPGALERGGVADRILLEQLAEFRPGEMPRRGVQALGDRLVFRRRGGGRAGLLQHRHRRIGRVLRDDQAASGEGFGRVAQFLHGGHVRQRGDAFLRKRGQHRQVAGLRDRGGFGDRHHDAAEQRLRHRAGALERHAEAFDAHRREDAQHAEMRLAAGPRMAIGEVLRLRLGEGGEFREGLERRLRAGHQHIGGVVGQADVAEAFHAERQLLQMRLCGERIIGRERDGVAVRLRLHEFDDPDGAGRATLVDDDHRLAERLAHLLLQRAAHQVGVPAGREGDDHGDRAGGESLRRRGRRTGQHRQGHQHGTSHLDH